MTAATTGAAGRSLSLTIDGQAVCVLEGTTLLEACRMQGITTPTLCYLDNLRPVNVCRVCVVELEGSRTLVPACSRRAESGMAVQTDSERVRLSRRLVLELLASSVDLSLAPALAPSLERYGVRPARFGPLSPARLAMRARLDTMRHWGVLAQKRWPSR
jgi:ferredoxin